MQRLSTHSSTLSPFDTRFVGDGFLSLFSGFLKKSNYNETTIIDILKVSDLEFIDEREFPIYESALQEDKTIDVLIKLFVLHLPVSTQAARDILGEFYAPSCTIGLIKETAEQVESLVDLYPCLGFYIATDHRFNCSIGELRVYYLGKDSYSLGRGMVDDKIDCALDLCTGSGVHAMLASRFARRVVCADLNPRAIAFVNFNIALNSVNNVESFLSDLYKDIPQIKYDLILSNPPFVPDPTFNHYFNSTISGEVILQRIIEELPSYLTANGLCQIFTLLIHKERHYLERIEDWVSGGIHVLAYEDLNFRYTSKDYILKHLDPYRNDPTYSSRLMEWYDAAEKEKNKMLADGILNIQLDADKKVSLAIDVNLSFHHFTDYVKAYFRPLENSNLEASLALNQEVEHLVKDVRQDGGVSYRVIFGPKALYRDFIITPEEYRLLKANFYHSPFKVNPVEINQLNLDKAQVQSSLRRLLKYYILTFAD